MQEPPCLAFLCGFWKLNTGCHAFTSGAIFASPLDTCHFTGKSVFPVQGEYTQVHSNGMKLHLPILVIIAYHVHFQLIIF